MRTLIILMCLAWAGPAAAQPDSLALTLQRDADLQARADLARQREVELNNRLSTLEARQQTDQALRDIDAMRQRPPLPTIYDPSAAPPAAAVPAGAFAAIPDAALAASNARVRAAAANRR
jgi:hypothetical protein